MQEHVGQGWVNIADHVRPNNSGKNRFNNRRVKVSTGFSGSGEQRCLDPGENKPSLPDIVSFRVGNPDSSC